jgi:hypothetical protein
MDFKRGEIVKVYYQRSTCIGHHIAQEICVKSGKDYYQLCWPILQNNDLLCEGDRVCFLIENGEIVVLRLDYCDKG